MSIIKYITPQRRAVCLQFIKYSFNCGIVLGCKLLLMALMIKIFNPSPAYLVVHIIIFFISYAIHSKKTFNVPFSLSSLKGYLRTVIGFKALDYLLFSVLLTKYNVEAMLSVVLATASVTVLRFIVVRKVLLPKEKTKKEMAKKK